MNSGFGRERLLVRLGDTPRTVKGRGHATGLVSSQPSIAGLPKHPNPPRYLAILPIPHSLITTTATTGAIGLAVAMAIEQYPADFAERSNKEEDCAKWIPFYF